MTPEIQVRRCTTLEEFHRCVQLQQLVWGESDLETEPYVAFVVANQTGGQVIGAFDGDKMIGFTMALAGYRNKASYLHSHMTGVLPEYRDRKVGRSLKLFQREEALSRDIRLIEWTFDPLETRNAHFNLNRLGAIVRTYIPNFYGITSSPLHRGIPTDRLLCEWRLDSKRVIAAINDLSPEPPSTPAIIHAPAIVGAGLARPTSIEVPPASSESSVIEIQSRIRSEFQHWLSKNYAATSVRFTPDGADYLLHPWSDF
jgi:predicted GNAT superfamily acetyltransferase